MTQLTVGLPVYNAMPFLPEAVDSILSQTLSDFRFLIINDGSTDESQDYLSTINDPRLTVIKQENQGVSVTANRILELTETEYLARIDADDVSLPYRLEVQFEILEKNREIVLLGTQVAFLTGQRTLLAPKTPTNHESIEKALLRGNIGFCNSSIMMRTEVAKKIGGYRVLGQGEDFDFFLRMCEAGRVANLNSVLHHYRIHLDSLVVSKHREVFREKEFAIECAKCRRNCKPEPTFKHFTAAWENRSLIKRGQEIINRWSSTQYRKALIEIANRKVIRGITRLGCVAVCRPGSSFRKIKAQLQ